jgi:hypothetical protein
MDRTHPRLASQVDTLHPALLRLGSGAEVRVLVAARHAMGAPAPAPVDGGAP